MCRVAWLRIALALLAAAPFASAVAEQATTSAATADPQTGSSPVPVDATQATPYVAPSTPDAGKGEWVVAPLPSISPSQGFTLALVAQYIFHPARASADTPPSIVGGAVFYTQQKSYGGAAGYYGHLADDRWRVQLAAGGGRINVEYYGIGAEASDHSVDLEQNATGAFAQVLRRVAPDWYVGGRLTHIDMRVRLDLDQVLPPQLQLPDVERDARTTSVGLALQGDTRDNTFQPQRGYLFDAKVDVFDGAFGSDFDYQIYQLSLDYFHPLGSAVLAARTSLRAARGDVPYWDLSSLGQGGDIRGYVAGRYRDRDLLAAQVEYRRPWKGRWSWVAFGGVGQVAPGLDELSSEAWKAAAGAGLRFRIAKDNPLNFRLDVAAGEDGAMVYLGIGEAF